MKHWAFLFLLVTLVYGQVETAWGDSVLVNTNVLRVRHQPKGKIIGRVYRGQQFIVLAKKSNWGKVEFQYGKQGWISLDYTKPLSLQFTMDTMDSFCKQLNAEFDKFRWKTIRCQSESWQAQMQSVEGHPLLYTVVGKRSPTSLLLCSVHSDENTSYQCFRFLQLLQKQPQLLNHRLVIAPLVNPDGFLKKRKTRTNARGVDLNRNLPTKLWQNWALKKWKQRYQSKARRYPGKSANSEPENQFVVWLIQRFNPDKIISLHAPMNFLDLDYLGGKKAQNASQRDVLKKAKILAIDFSKESNYRFRDYRTFVGSLGRFGGEWKIPIYTLELPNSDYTKAEIYFKRLKQSLFNAFNEILDHNRTAQFFPASKQIKVAGNQNGHADCVQLTQSKRGCKERFSAFKKQAIQ